MIHKSLFIKVLLTASLLVTGGAQAQTQATVDKIYQVDLVVFRHLNAGGVSSETWQRPDPVDELSLDDLEDIEDLSELQQIQSGEPLTEELAEEELPPSKVYSGPDILSADENGNPLLFRLLSEEEAGLQDEAQRVDNSSYYELLLHTSWQQQVISKRWAEAFPVIAAGVEPSVLDGTALLYKERYLHVALDLGIPMNARSLMAGSGDQYTLKQSRRINRSSVLHYFDHPKLGVLVMVSEVKLPEEDGAL